ncbi:rib/alpha-like repeat family protein [Acinetobacter baumannii 24845_6]|nr:rib/alpha-like repeat family protein [Acinetobacter baumannii 24845_6]
MLDPINATDPVSGQAEPGSTVTVTYPDGTTATVVAGTDAPVLDPINATDPVSGQAEPGSTVTVTYPDGTTATVVAGTECTGA